MWSKLARLSLLCLGIVALGLALGLPGCQSQEDDGQLTPVVSTRMATAAPTLEPTPVPIPPVTPVATAAPMPTPSPETILITEPLDPCGPSLRPYSRELYEHFVYWTSDGAYLVFDVGDTIWTVDIEDGRLRQVADADKTRYNFLYGFHADVSPDGTRIVYSTCEYVLDRPSISRIGGSEIYTEGYEIASVNIDGTDRKRLTENAHFDHYPVWSPNGSRIAFIANLNDSYWEPASTWIFTMSKDGDDKSGPALAYKAALYPPVWSPDGQSLAFIVNEEDYYPSEPIIYTVHVDVAVRNRIGKTTALPTWSPDGDELAFASVDGDEPMIYTVKPDGTEMRQVWSDEADGASTPVSQVSWSPDGLELLFISDRLYTIRLDDGVLRPLPGVSPDNPSVARASWSPDGSRIAVYDPGDGLITVSRDGADLRILAEVDDYGRVRALNSPPIGIPANPAACSAGIVVPEPDGNEGLVQDCEALLAARDQLAGGAELSWNESLPIYQWQGVAVRGSPPRVVELVLWNRGLSGEIPRELGSLTEMRALLLYDNSLSGPVPSELGKLPKMLSLDLSNNDLVGGIPPELGGLPNLQYLDLSFNQLSESIPVELAHLTSLRYLNLSRNSLGGNIPAELSTLVNLYELNLSDNSLTGSIPVEISALVKLIGLQIDGNDLVGCVATGLSELWVEQSGLKRCDPVEPSDQ